MHTASIHVRARACVAAVIVALVLALGLQPVEAIETAADTSSFAWVEATITDAHAAMVDGELSCVDLVEGYLSRILAFDRQGPTLQSVLSISPTAMDEAHRLDEALNDGGLVGPLHCVPVVLKDNVDTFDQPTTAGSRSLEGSQPPDDAFAVARMRARGAIVLGKANMDEFAFGFGGSSSLGGQVRNPYDPARGPGGSSSGSAAAVAASLAMVGVGSDTGGSIRVPSSVQGLVGIRPSLRLVSGDGVIPLARFQDVIGPMCRTVQDCALLLDAMVGFDGSTFSGQHTEPLQRDDEAVLLATAADYATVTGVEEDHTYADALRRDGLDGARIGVVRALFGNDADVHATMESAIAVMRAAGAVVEDVTIPELSRVTSYASVSQSEFRDHLTEYLRSWPSDDDGHKRSFEEVALSGQYEQSRVASLGLYGVKGVVRPVDPDYEANTRERSEVVPPRLLAALDNTSLDGEVLGPAFDALLYPSVLSPPRVGGAPATGSNNRLSAFSGFPALTLPAGFTSASAERVALPIGMELLGREFAEATLLRLAFGYQEAVAGTPLARQAPTTTPELPPGGPALGTSAPRTDLLWSTAGDAILAGRSELHRQ
jgi:amidase